MTTWTESEILTLTAMWNKGHTGSQIARVLRKTRNAVIGKVHCLELPERSMPARPVKRYSKFDPKMMPALYPGGHKMVSSAAPIPMASLTNESCRWPIGDPKAASFGFCGCNRHEGSPYCQAHTKAATSGAQLKRVTVPPEYNVRRVTPLAA